MRSGSRCVSWPSSSRCSTIRSARTSISRDVDIDCLDLIDREGPLSPSKLARLAGLHPATITGILDRLERGGWITRERDPADRRAILVRVRRERLPDLLRLYAGMNRSMNQIYAGYNETRAQSIADFLQRTAKAGKKQQTSYPRLVDRAVARTVASRASQLCARASSPDTPRAPRVSRRRRASDGSVRSPARLRPRTALPIPQSGT